VDIILGVMWEIVVDDDLQILDIDSSGRDIRGDEKLEF
jgi:hypothetical protein